MHWTVRLEARTSAGEVRTTELVTFGRPAVVGTLAEAGLLLGETKTLLAKLQASMLCGQVAAYAAHPRACAACGMLRLLEDRRTRRLQTLFGTVEVAAPRFKACRCCQPVPMAGTVLFSLACALLTARCTPELMRVQAGPGARTSRRNGARILEALLPVSPAKRESLRARTHAVALQLGADGRQAAAEVTAARGEPAEAVAADDHRPVVMLDGAYIRAVPGHQVRDFEAICGKAEREGEAVTAISDGDRALPALVRSATGGLVEPVLDWFHLSMRLHHVERVMGGLCAVEPPPLVPIDQARIGVERLRHLLWNGDHDKAARPWAGLPAGPRTPACWTTPQRKRG